MITIDGPAGAGKSTAARSLANDLGLRYLDTGAMYRAVTWIALRDQVDFSSDAALEAAAKALRLDMPADGRVVAAGVDVTRDIRNAEVTRNVSRVAAVSGVRRVMVERQRAFAVEGGLVAEGRDMATVVFPDADFKFYLDASPTERAKRRVQEIHERGGEASLADVEADIRRRDAYDSSREASPLRRGTDTLYVDTTHLDPRAVVQALLEKVVD
ncbi:MAG: (d)CMP kinase [Planctomycetes bacterium]|nr:(d)CMP kinase [Planctomycetota bacterium]MBI3848558.1 (d)CMP kinase [Planctomycetota bacterium]